jgi:dolichyl-phosphate-mannose-protein mannosyltransferase
VPPERSSVAWKAVLAVGAVTLLTGALRFYRLSDPPEKIFDEVYYASDGCWYAGEPYRSCGLEDDTERSWVHPPLGKQIIAVGIDAFGNRPFGWRVASAAAGTATVALVGVLGFLLFASPLWAAVGALLAGTENLLFVQSRVAMLDAFLALFIVLGFVLLVADRVRTGRRLTATEAPTEQEREREPVRRGWRPLRLAAGASFGAAIAVKWSGVLALLGALILSVAWERTRRRRAGEPRSLRAALAEEGFGLYLALAVVPLLVYALTWLPWLADRGYDLAEWARHHGDMAGYHLGLETVKENGEPIHPYMSRAWSWLLLLRPVAYFWQGDPDCCAEILGMGHPFLFWGALLALPYLALSWRTRRDWRAGALLVPVLIQFLPWLAASRPLFLFYMTPVTPFLALGTAYVLRDVAGMDLSRRITAPAVALVVAVCVALFAFFWPVLIGDQVTPDAWRTRMWFDSWI